MPVAIQSGHFTAIKLVDAKFTVYISKWKV